MTAKKLTTNKRPQVVLENWGVQVLLCPVCGGMHLHQDEVVSLGDRINIYFWCEGACKPILEIYPYKGQTRVEWVECGVEGTLAADAVESWLASSEVQVTAPEVTPERGITEEDFRSMLEAHPYLNYSGGTSGRYDKRTSLEEHDQHVQQQRAALEDDFPDVLKVAEWIRSNTYMTKRITKYSSYGWKHVAEKELGYVSNGQFIAAAILCGYRVQEDEFNPRMNIRLNKETKRRLALSHPWAVAMYSDY